ncbi:SNARE associated Golgi protein [Geobacillus sp. 12AMOR1]|nr:SNARE associated Golgi protein [Geobacillus sp. 12AMOR1]
MILMLPVVPNETDARRCLQIGCQPVYRASTPKGKQETPTSVSRRGSSAANLTVFGFWPGFWVSFAGEAIGAVVSFVLYRKGLRRWSQTTWLSHPKVKPLLHASGKEAFGLIFALRLLPFVPSGAVTFVAAIGRTSLLVFATASSLGKLPALWMEAYAVHQFLEAAWAGKLMLAVASIVLLWFVWRKIGQKAAG